MNVNGINSKNIIDAQSAAQVTEQLFSALSKKSVDLSKTDLSKFNRQTLGIDFYNRKTDIDFQRQIAIANSGAFEQRNINSSIQLLNSLAAMSAYAENTPKNLGGKMTIDQNFEEVELISYQSEAEAKPEAIENNLDKKDSNPFSYDYNQKGEKQENN